MKLILNKFKNQKNRGFTLIELLLYMGLFSILIVILMQLFSSIFDIRLESEAVSSVDNDGKFILQRFTYDIYRASEILVPSTLGSASASLTITADDQDLFYSLIDGDLILENLETGTSDQLNSTQTSVSDLTFLRLDGNGKDVVQINFVLTSEINRTSGIESQVFETVVGLR